MSDKRDISSEITAITDPLLRMTTAFPRELIGASLRRILDDAGPNQAALLRRCAIPRWFDTDVLAVLRGKLDGNDRVIDLLRNYSFVRQLDAGRFAYHEEVRETLLADWRAQHLTELREWNQRLAAYFRERAASILPTRTLPKGPSTSTVSVGITGDWDLLQREALYHTLMADPAAGMTELDTAFAQAEATHRLGDAEALLQITRNVPLDARGQWQVRFMRARLDRAGLNLNAAEAQFDTLLAEPVGDPLLEARVHQSLGEVYAETSRWVQATEHYRKAQLAFAAQGRQYEAAEVWRLMGEAYQELGASTGGWHIPAYPQSRFWRALGQTWTWLLSLPFYLILLFLRPTGARLPLPRYLASYRNWTLVWLYRTAAACYEKARATFEQLGDDTGMLRAERQLADLTRLFGHPQEALLQVAQTLGRPAALDPYQRSWVEWVCAAAFVDMGKVAQARPIINTLLTRFREVGDARREAAALALQGRAAARAGDHETALTIYKECLDRYRHLDSVAIRELVLYDLRALCHQEAPGNWSQQIGAVLAAEPAKRYVARFPRSQLPLLRVLSVVAVPLLMLAVAVIAPRESVARVAELASLQTTINPWTALLVIAVLLVLYSALYALVAIAVITFVPLGDLDREQPDYFVTDPNGISRYDFRGARAQRIEWGEVGRWLRIERYLWARPVSLLSGAFLESQAGEDMQIDGITGWYLSLQEDIDTRLQETGSRVQPENFGFTVIRSWGGLSAGLGFVLLMLFIWSQNTWAQWLVELLPPYLYAAVSLLAFSGLLILVPIAYWLAINPLSLRRTLNIRDYYPFAVIAVGVAMVVVGVAGLVPRVPPLNFGLVITGALILGYALAILLAMSSRTLRLIVAALAVMAGVAYVGTSVLPTFLLLVSRAGADRVVLSAGAPAQAEAAEASLEASRRIENNPDTPLPAKAQALTNRGRVLYVQGDFNGAFAAYSEALDIYERLPPGALTDQARAVVLYNRYRARKDGGGEGWSKDLEASCALVADVGPDCQT